MVRNIPSHIYSKQLQDFKDEMKNLGFYLESQMNRTLVHEKNIQRGELLNFRAIK